VYNPNEAWSHLARIDHMADGDRGDVLWFNTDLNGASLEVTDERGDIRWSGSTAALVKCAGRQRILHGCETVCPAPSAAALCGPVCGQRNRCTL